MVTPITIEDAFRRLQDHIAEYSAAGNAVTPVQWRDLRVKADHLCDAIKHQDTASAQTLLPMIGDMITALDQMIEDAHYQAQE